MDFSSNFNAPNIDKLLLDLGIKNPTNIQREMFSRDFTCNALLLSLDLKQLSDPTYRGFKDIKDRTIRTCLSPEITLTTNKNRVIRSIDLATKLDFDIDPAIIDFVKKNPQSAKISTNKVMVEKINKAFEKDADRASSLISKMGLWDYIPIPEIAQPYYTNRTKVAYFQGGGGINEPTPGKVKYKADKAIMVQPRFVEPLYRNYDLYYTEGVNGKPDHGPGVGWNSVMDYGSIKEYLEETRKVLRGKYVADDSYITDDNYKERESKMKIRAKLLSELIKTSQRNFDYGKGLYDNMDKYDSVKGFLGDDNKLDFPSDDFESTPIIGNSESYETPSRLGPVGGPFDTSIFPGQSNLGDFESYPYSAQLGGLMDKYLPQNDSEDKKPEELILVVIILTATRICQVDVMKPEMKES